jgi:glutaredoxin-related protein
MIETAVEVCVESLACGYSERAVLVEESLVVRLVEQVDVLADGSVQIGPFGSPSPIDA